MPESKLMFVSTTVVVFKEWLFGIIILLHKSCRSQAITSLVLATIKV